MDRISPVSPVGGWNASMSSLRRQITLHLLPCRQTRPVYRPVEKRTHRSLILRCLKKRRTHGEMGIIVTTNKYTYYNRTADLRNMIY
jgi:hypothetical protein